MQSGRRRLRRPREVCATVRISIKLDDLDVICAALDCQIGELLIPEPVQAIAAVDEQTPQAVGQNSAVVPKLRSGRSLPPR